MSLHLSMVTLCTSLVVAGCQVAKDTETETMPFDTAEHVGVWESDGYGWVVDIEPDTVRLYHSADDICIEQAAGELSILNFLDLYRSSDGGNVLHVFSVLDPYEYTFHRSSGVPPKCRVSPLSTATGNFDALADYFGTHYAFFDLYDIDWKERVRRYRESLTDTTSDKVLFDLMSDLLSPLKDSHIQIEAEIGGEEFTYDGNPGKTDLSLLDWADRMGKSESEAVVLFRRGYWIDDIQTAILGGKGVMAGNGRIQYGIHAEKIGYIAFVSMGGFVNGELDTAYAELAALDSILDDAFGLFESTGVAGVIVDLSLNIGGYDFVGLSIAGRFAGAKTVAFTRRAGDDPLSEDFVLYVEPHDGPKFTGPVFLLTSDLTVSAAEILTLSLRSLDNVTHLGERTRGAFSTVLTKYLPNGWELSLSNEIYTDSRGVVWEGRGIAPTVPIAVFDNGDPTKGHVAAVQSVVRMIAR